MRWGCLLDNRFQVMDWPIIWSSGSHMKAIKLTNFAASVCCLLDRELWASFEAIILFCRALHLCQWLVVLQHHMTHKELSTQLLVVERRQKVAVNPHAGHSIEPLLLSCFTLIDLQVSNQLGLRGSVQQVFTVSCWTCTKFLLKIYILDADIV